LTAHPPLLRRRFYYGWWVVFASASIVFLSAGTFFYGFGLLVTPLTDEFGWSRAAVSAAFSLRTEVGGVAAPVVGFAVDRVGVRRLLIAGVWVVALGFVLLSRADTLWAFYGAVVVIAIGNSATGGATATVTVANWFRRQRGRALGFMTLGGGVSGLMAIVFAWLISAFGWRDALLIAGLGQLVVCFPLALSIRNRPQDMGLPIDGVEADDLPVAERAEAAVEAGQGWTSKEAVRSLLFWRVALVYAFSNFATTAIIVHQVPFLTESVGVSEAFAATTLTVMTGLSIIGRLGFGSAADVLPKRLVTAVALAAIALGVALFATVTASWQLIYVLPLFGIGFGGIIPVRSTLQAEYFGLRAFGAIQGLTLTISTIGAFAGPILAGWMYDVSGSYRLAFVLLALGPLLAIPLILTARPQAPRAQLP
jgi:sugar phosphate permease